MYARVAFGMAAVLAGVVALLPHDAGLWHRLLAVAQIAAGAAMLHPRTARCGLLLLGGVYAYFSLATIPGIVRAPGAYVSYGAFFEAFAVVCGTLVASAGRAARIGLGLCALSYATAQVVYRTFTASLIPAWLPAAAFWVDLTTVALLLAAVALLIDRRSRLAARLVALMLALFGVLVWIPQLAARPAALGNWSEFAETVLIGAAFLAAAGFFDPEDVQGGQT